MNKPQTFQEITPDQVQQWKTSFPKLRIIEVPLDKEDDPELDKAQYYVRPLSVNQMNAISELADDKKRGGAVKAGDSILASCILGGDMKFLEKDCADSTVYVAVMEQLGNVLNEKKSYLKKV